MAAGDVPYRDFVMPFPPGTFLIQAALIRIFGSHFALHVAYAALISGAATVLTYKILIMLFEDQHERPRLIAFFLALPLVLLGIYSIFPHPFYDPDAGFLMVIALWAILECKRRPRPAWMEFAAGALISLPLFFKQNLGGAFIFMILLALTVSALWADRGTRVMHTRLIAGAFLAVAAILLVVDLTVGLRNYFRWTVAFAAEQRLGSLVATFDSYLDNQIWIAVAIIITGSLLLRAKKSTQAAGAMFVLVAFAWIGLRMGDFEAVLRFWPLILLISAAGGLVVNSWGRPASFQQLLPFVIFGVAHASFLSQGVEGSTYGIWPLLMIAAASMVVAFGKFAKGPGKETLLLLAATIGILISLSGFQYIWHNPRLDYAADTGPIHRSTSKALRGLSAQGRHVPDLDRTLAWIETNIPKGEPMVAYPGEDPIYFALERHPPLPLVLFDYTNNPYSFRKLREMVDEQEVNWLLIKGRLQLHQPGATQEAVSPMGDDFEQVSEVGGYIVLKRHSP